MGFSVKQLRALKRNPDHRHIRTREANGRELTYLEGWYAITEANRIFGFDGWSRETIESKCILAREKGGTFLAVYVARVRLTVQADGVNRHSRGPWHRGRPRDVARRGARHCAQGRRDRRHQAGAWLPSAGRLVLSSTGAARPQAQQKPLPSSPSIAANEANETKLVPDHQSAPDHQDRTVEASSDVASSNVAPTAGSRVGFHPDDTTPIPRPSHYYGRRHQNPIARHFRDERQQAEQTIATSARTPLSPAPPLAPGAQPEPAPGRIDKSVLTIAEPKRLRDKAHLGFVASQPCLVCGRQPSDPHHLRFAQPRAIGLKVSDEFTVPLCRGHHRQLHQAGNEVTWWGNFNLKPLEVAKALWGQTHPKSADAADVAIQPSAEDATTSTTET